MIFDETHTEQIRMCAACPKMCRHVCPTFFAWRSDSPTPHGRALLIHQAIIGTREIDERGVEVLFQCLECSHCLTWCKPEIDIATIVEEQRKALVAEERRPKGLVEMAQAIRQFHNPYSEPHMSRNNWLPIKKKKGGKSLFYFIGCTAAYREQEIASSTVDLLESLGYRISIGNGSSDEWCCGSPLFRTGDVELGLEQARHNAQMLNEMNVDEIIVTCPGCFRALSKDYPEHGLILNKPVRHISQLLNDIKDNLPAIDFMGKITYHDPCHLGRHSKIYDEPRNVIKQVSNSNLNEMERTRDNAMCCGNGAGLRTLFPEHAKKIGMERVQQAKQSGASILVTACPFCKNMLQSQSGNDLIVLDLPELVLQAKRGRKVKTH
ncbi:MAG: (Fe-S)-binding protein [Candidatus Thorarchaeota archaeon]|nr:(Fe-S)-binding protein [Candidatus Thorarchaeota archaeon]